MRAAASAAPARVKKLGLSQSASFLVRRVAGVRKGRSVVAPPKQAKPQGKVAVPNGSQVAAGHALEKKAKSARVPAVRQSMPDKPESVDSSPNDASSEVQEFYLLARELLTRNYRRIPSCHKDSLVLSGLA